MKNPVPASATVGLEDFRKDGSEPMTRPKKLCSVGPKWVYVKSDKGWRKSKKLIPSDFIFEGESRRRYPWIRNNPIEGDF